MGRGVLDNGTTTAPAAISTGATGHDGGDAAAAAAAAALSAIPSADLYGGGEDLEVSGGQRQRRRRVPLVVAGLVAAVRSVGRLNHRLVIRLNDRLDHVARLVGWQQLDY
ncbi:hypothetical protein TYRP_020484 [Tyrophagus putrescentiae]|nr:hypothetical protein TYRP_020484 [Tyrophagus putrescentiae]